MDYITTLQCSQCPCSLYNVQPPALVEINAVILKWREGKSPKYPSFSSFPEMSASFSYSQQMPLVNPSQVTICAVSEMIPSIQPILLNNICYLTKVIWVNSSPWFLLQGLTMDILGNGKNMGPSGDIRKNSGVFQGLPQFVNYQYRYKISSGNTCPRHIRHLVFLDGTWQSMLSPSMKNPVPRHHWHSVLPSELHDTHTTGRGCCMQSKIS